jgi:CubicO group peptidase (beta-lactamase class C family)
VVDSVDRLRYLLELEALLLRVPVASHALSGGAARSLGERAGLVWSAVFGRLPTQPSDVGRGDVPGVVAMAADDNGVIYEGAAGRRAADADDPIGPDTMFRSLP